VAPTAVAAAGPGPTVGSLADSLARAAVRLGLPAPVDARPAAADGWPELSVPALTGEGGAADDLPPAAAIRAVTAVTVVAGRLTGVSDQRLLATWVSGWFVHWAVGPALLAWLDDRRVAPLDPAQVAVWWDGEGDVFVRAGGDRWAVLPDDPLAGSGAAEVVQDEHALCWVLHDRITSLLAPLFDCFRTGARVGLRQQWLQAADRIALILQGTGAEVGRETQAVAAAERLLGQPGSPFRSARGRFLTVAGGAPTVHAYQRATCCLAFRAPDGTICPTCPVRPARTPAA
jgi:hypothetical protein